MATPRSASYRCRKRENPTPGGRFCCRRSTTRRGLSAGCPSVRAAMPAPIPMRWQSGKADIRKAVSTAPYWQRTVPRSSAQHVFRTYCRASVSHLHSWTAGIATEPSVLSSSKGLYRSRMRASTPFARSLGHRSAGSCRSAAMRCRSRRRLWPRDAERMTRDPGLAPRPGILDISPYVGGEAKAAGVERPIRLASNESALGPSSKAIAAYRALASEIHRYPDGNAEELREALGRCHGVDPARIVCGAGSDELIALLLRCYAGPGDEVLYSRHGFLMYPINAMAAGATPIAAPERELKIDVDAMLARVTERTRIVIIANPNNPTGTYLGAQDLARLHAGLPPS